MVTNVRVSYEAPQLQIINSLVTLIFLLPNILLCILFSWIFRHSAIRETHIHIHRNHKCIYNNKKIRVKVILYVIMERQVGTVLHNIMRQKTDIYLRKIILSVVLFYDAISNWQHNVEWQDDKIQRFSKGKEKAVVLSMVPMNLQGLNKTTYNVRIIDGPG